MMKLGKKRVALVLLVILCGCTVVWMCGYPRSYLPVSSESSPWKPNASEQRVLDYLNHLERDGQSPRVYVSQCLTPEDLSTLRLWLQEGRFVTAGRDLMMAICILERDPAVSLNEAVAFLERKDNWRGIRDQWDDVSMPIMNKAVSILIVGYIDSAEAKTYLIEHLDRKVAYKLAKKMARSGTGLHTAEELATIIQQGAAHGLLVSRDDKAFQHVISAFETNYYKHRGGGLEAYRLVTSLQDVITEYRFLQDKGWEEGYALLFEIGSDYYLQIAHLGPYEPPFPGMVEGEQE